MAIKYWTKDEIKQLVTLWDAHTLEEIAAKLDRKPSSIVAMSIQLRKAGLKLSQKRKNGYMAHMVAEVVKEIQGV